MEQLAFISPTVASTGLMSQPAQTRPAMPAWSLPATSLDTAHLWQHVALLQTRLAGINQRRNGPSYKVARQQLSRIALLLLPNATDLSLASVLLNFLLPGHLAIGQAQVQAKAQHVSGQALQVLDDLDSRGLMHLLIAVYGDAHCQAVTDYVHQRLARMETDQL